MKSTEKTSRRQFLKTAGIVPAATLSSGAMAKGLNVFGSGYAELDKQLATLADDEKLGTAQFIQLLHDDDILLTPPIAGVAKKALDHFLAMAKHFTGADVRLKEHKEQWFRQRDGLMGQAKIDFIHTEIKSRLCGWRCHLHKGLLQKVAVGRWTKSKNLNAECSEIEKVLFGNISELFEGRCTKSYRQKVIGQYIENILPSVMAEYDKAIAYEKAMDKLVALFDDRTTKEVELITEIISELPNESEFLSGLPRALRLRQSLKEGQSLRNPIQELVSKDLCGRLQPNIKQLTKPASEDLHDKLINILNTKTRKELKRLVKLLSDNKIKLS